MTGSDRLLVKCLVWDLDDTVWDGVLLEDPRVELRPGVREVITGLDNRGILQSVASRNDEAAARRRLREFDLDQFFVRPRIGWSAKSESVRDIAATLNLGLDAIGFVDDSPFERDEVRFELPEVRCYPATEVSGLLHRAEFNPRVVTADGHHRRLMYQAEERRSRSEREFAGSAAEFLRTLDLQLTVRPLEAGDLDRAEELTVRTHQLNTTGRAYSRTDLDAMRRSTDHLVLVARLQDRYGDYGTIGLAVVTTVPDRWSITLLLMSCRVMSRGIGGVVIDHLRRAAIRAGVPLFADFVSNDRNRMMYVTYRLNGFREVSREADRVLLRAPDQPPGPVPDHVVLIDGQAVGR